MTLKITKTTSEDFKPTVNLLVYGLPKVGKSTFATSAPKPLVIDLEGGYKYMGKRGINVDVINITKFDEMREVYDIASKSDYETIIIDPVNELVERLIDDAKKEQNFTIKTNKNKLSIDGWMFVKDTMKKLIKTFRDMNKHVIFVAHMVEKDDEGVTMKRPKIDANLSDELCRNMDIIVYMTNVGSGENLKRVLLSQGNEKYFAGDRTGVLAEIVEPDFSKIIDAVVENKQFVWTKKLENNIEKSNEEFEKDLK
jgi:hypothetical protein